MILSTSHQEQEYTPGLSESMLLLTQVSYSCRSSAQDIFMLIRVTRSNKTQQFEYIPQLVNTIFHLRVEEAVTFLALLVFQLFCLVHVSQAHSDLSFFPYWQKNNRSSTLQVVFSKFVGFFFTCFKSTRAHDISTLNVTSAVWHLKSSTD